MIEEVIMGYVACDVCMAMRRGPPFAQACAVQLVRLFKLAPGRFISICDSCRCKLMICNGGGIRLKFRHRQTHGSGSYHWDEVIPRG